MITRNPRGGRLIDERCHVNLTILELAQFLDTCLSEQRCISNWERLWRAGEVLPCIHSTIMNSCVTQMNLN